MSQPLPRLRVFAGPNGSGKSTIKEVLPLEWLGVYLNPDEIEKAIRKDGCLELAAFEVSATQDELQDFLRHSTLLAKAGLRRRPSSCTWPRARWILGRSR